MFLKQIIRMQGKSDTMLFYFVKCFKFISSLRQNTLLQLRLSFKQRDLHVSEPLKKKIVSISGSLETGKAKSITQDSFSRLSAHKINTDQRKTTVVKRGTMVPNLSRGDILLLARC